MEIEKKRLPVSVSAAVYIEDEEGRLLLLQQEAESKGRKWGPPAGGMEAHEDPVMCAIREAEEEIGVKVELSDLIGIYIADRGDSATGLAFAFRGKIIDGQINPLKGEISAFGYFTPDEVEDLAKQDLLYKPEYNVPAFKDFLVGKSYPLSLIRPHSNDKKTQVDKVWYDNN